MSKFLSCILILVGLAAFAEPAITLDRVQQRYPWNGIVDVDYTVSGVVNPFVYRAELFVTANGGKKIRAKTFLSSPDLSNGSHRLSWNAKEDGADYVSKNVQFRLSLRFAEPAKDGDYMIVDLSGGPDAQVYNVTYLSDVADPTNFFNTTENKTDKIVFKKIKAGSFWMGTPADSPFYKDGEKRHYVTLTNDFFIGMFMLTAGQYVRVTGEEMTAGLTPEMGQNGTIGGIDGLLKEDGFFARLNARAMSAHTHVSNFNAPTEAEWEYACRAGTTTTWFFGEDSSEFSKYAFVGSAHVTPVVGSKLPNPWCLWDMYGYAQEYTYDTWNANAYPDSTEENPAIEPVEFNPLSRNNRPARGGASWETANECRSARRATTTADTKSTSNGFRLAIPCHGSGSVIE